MNTPVKFEIAKLLKEKGFNEPTLDWYHRDTKKFNTNDLMFSMNRLSDNYSAPTIAEVVMWLYEKYGIWTVVNVNIMGSWYFEHFDLKEKRNAQFEPTDTHYDSLTEAYEAAIEYTLNNLL
jgi:hypothetical protein